MEQCKTEVCVVLCTASPEESEEICRHLVEKGLAACINIVPVRSSYTWDGEFCIDNEDLMIIKTAVEDAEKLKDEILKVHSYDLPEVIIIPVTGGHAPYLEWVCKKLE